MIPITRIEKFLNGIIYGSSVPEPITRIEVMLNDIKNGDVVSLTPITREEIYLAKISGANVEIPTPIKREEMYLAKIAGLTIETPSPIVRIEHWLNDWAGGSDPLNTFTGAIVRFFSRFEKPIVKLEANFTPIQSLNGQEAPYPPGGGKNLLSTVLDDIKSKNTSGSWSGDAYTYNDVTFTVISDDAGNITGINVNGTATANTPFYIVRGHDMAITTEGLYISGCPSGGTSSTYRVRASNGTTVNEYGSGVQFTSGNTTIDLYIQILNGYAASNLLFKPMIAASSDLTFAPYSNICPISGHTGCEVVRTGKNLIDIADSESTITGAASTAFAAAIRSIKFKENTQYTFSIKTKALDASSSAKVWYARFHHTDGTAIGYTASVINRNTEETGQTMTVYSVTSGANKTVDYIEFTQGTQYGIAYEEAILAEGASATFEPYQGTTVSISFGTTVYGGKLTVFEDGSGQVVADRAIFSYPDSTGFASHSSGRWYHNGLPSGADYSKRTSVTSNQATYSDSTRTYKPYFAFGSSGVYINKLSADETIEQFDARLQANPFQICYFLAEPVTIPLTAEQIATLPGVNNVWVNAATGDITVQAYGTEIS